MLVCMCSPSFYLTVVYQLPKNANIKAAVRVLNSLLLSLVRANNILVLFAHFFNLPGYILSAIFGPDPFPC
jgi:hypothetical protein